MGFKECVKMCMAFRNWPPKLHKLYTLYTENIQTTCIMCLRAFEWTCVCSFKIKCLLKPGVFVLLLIKLNWKMSTNRPFAEIKRSVSRFLVFVSCMLWIDTSIISRSIQIFFLKYYKHVLLLICYSFPLWHTSSGTADNGYWAECRVECDRDCMHT